MKPKEHPVSTSSVLGLKGCSSTWCCGSHSGPHTYKGSHLPRVSPQAARHMTLSLMPCYSFLPCFLWFAFCAYYALFLLETGIKKTSHLPLGAQGKQKMSEFQTLQRGDSSALLRWPRASTGEDGGVPESTKELVLQDLPQGLLLCILYSNLVFSFPFFSFLNRKWGAHNIAQLACNLPCRLGCPQIQRNLPPEYRVTDATHHAQVT